MTFSCSEKLIQIIRDDTKQLPSEDEVDVSDDESAGEDDDTSAKEAYKTLLESLSTSNPPQAKRRKIERTEDPAEEVAEPTAEERSQLNQDEVDESEEEEEDEILPGAGDDDSDEEDDSDPFDNHFAHPDESASAVAVSAAKQNKWKANPLRIAPLRATVQFPDVGGDFKAPPSINSVDDMRLKQKLRQEVGKKLAKLDATEQALASLMFNYRDVLYCNRTVNASQRLLRLTCMHALNHVFKTRDRVIKNNYKLAKEGTDSDLELRDQGFTRPKVLFIVPTRNSCAKIVSTIRELCKPDQEENRKRFDESYITKDSNFGQDRPEDFRDLFEGNDDDMFRIGVKFTRKTVKYFSQFYSSDILIASPLGLRMAIGSDEDKKKLDADFLSSIEMVVVDQADALLMQNWEHIEYIFEHLNLQPKDAHGCDFSRVRNWYLEDWSKYFRQTIILSAFNTPELAELQRRHCYNWAGKVRIQPKYPGVIESLGVKTKQTFSRFQAASVAVEPDAKFEYFVSAIVPSIVKRAKDAHGTLIFVPSYLDFVRVRNYFGTAIEVSGVSFGAISEYTDTPEASRARSHFVTGRHKVLLLSERAHHFRRYQIKGVQRIIFYGLPGNPIFYKEIAGGYLAKSEQDMLIDPGKGAVRAVFSKYDAMALERIVGTERAQKMIPDRGDTFEFV